nr:MAG TPA: hypothetical protein [Caudoviricetes sp.]DAW35489.1 MAG TPA: hypothetical protein [Caudoviricetes sp.]
MTLKKSTTLLCILLNLIKSNEIYCKLEIISYN